MSGSGHCNGQRSWHVTRNNGQTTLPQQVAAWPIAHSTDMVKTCFREPRAITLPSMRPRPGKPKRKIRPAAFCQKRTDNGQAITRRWYGETRPLWVAASRPATRRSSWHATMHRQATISVAGHTKARESCRIRPNQALATQKGDAMLSYDVVEWGKPLQKAEKQTPQ